MLQRLVEQANTVAEKDSGQESMYKEHMVLLREKADDLKERYATTA